MTGKISLSVLLAAGAMSVAAQADVVVYQDSFSRGTVQSPAVLGGSQPDVANTGGHVWTANGGDHLGNAGSYFTNGDAAVSGAWNPFAYLPVNGTSGITLDGSRSFTLSATITGTQTIGRAGIFLSSNPTSIYGPAIIAQSLISMSDHKDYIWGPGNDNWLGGMTVADPSATHTISLSYDAATQLMHYGLDGGFSPTTHAMSSAQIASITAVCMGMDGYDASGGDTGPGRIDDFTLTVAVPEPASMALLGLGAGAVVLRRRRA